jgi:hypothetical protein
MLQRYLALRPSQNGSSTGLRGMIKRPPCQPSACSNCVRPQSVQEHFGHALVEASTTSSRAWIPSSRTRSWTGSMRSSRPGPTSALSTRHRHSCRRRSRRRKCAAARSAGAPPPETRASAGAFLLPTPPGAGPPNDRAFISEAGTLARHRSRVVRDPHDRRGRTAAPGSRPVYRDEARDRQRESLGPTFRDVTIDLTHLLHSQRVARDVHGRANPGRWILDDRYGGYPDVVGGDELPARAALQGTRAGPETSA